MHHLNQYEQGVDGNENPTKSMDSISFIENYNVNIDKSYQLYRNRFEKYLKKFILQINTNKLNNICSNKLKY